MAVLLEENELSMKPFDVKYHCFCRYLFLFVSCWQGLINASKWKMDSWFLPKFDLSLANDVTDLNLLGMMESVSACHVIHSLTF